MSNAEVLSWKDALEELQKMPAGRRRQYLSDIPVVYIDPEKCSDLVCIVSDIPELECRVWVPTYLVRAIIYLGNNKLYGNPGYWMCVERKVRCLKFSIGDKDSRPYICLEDLIDYLGTFTGTMDLDNFIELFALVLEFLSLRLPALRHFVRLRKMWIQDVLAYAISRLKDILNEVRHSGEPSSERDS